MYSSNGFETGVIYCDDNLERLRNMPPESVDLIYLDPPFFSNRHYEVIWGDEAEIRSFEDRWKGGIYHYIDWMHERMVEMYHVLKPTGSIYLHCDWHAGHYLKIMMDSIFGLNSFRNDIVWHYSGWNKRLKTHFERRSDSILFYAKGPGQVFNSWSRPWKNVAEYLRVRKQKLRTDENGRDFVYSDAGGGRRVKRYIDEAMASGVHTDNVWDIDKLNNSSQERLGYPTQKPEALLERIIHASSNPGDIVLDPFCGCGTTIAVAQQMQRRWIRIDISLTAAEIMKARVESVGAWGVRIKGEPKSKDDLRKLKPFEFQNWVIRQVVGDHSRRQTGDMGIDGFSHFERLPIQIKRSEKVGRPVVDNFETAVERYGVKKGYIVALSFTSGAYEEVARVRDAKGLEIELIEAEDIRTGKSHLVPPRAGRRVLEYRREDRPTMETLEESEQKSPPEAPTEAA